MSQPPPEQGEPDLLRHVADAVDTGEPFDVMALTSTLLSAVEPQPQSPFERHPEPEAPSREELVETFVEIDLPETTALLAAIAAFSDDEVLRRRLHHEITTRAHPLPDWLAELDRARAGDRAVEMSHVLGDGENQMFEVMLPGGHVLTAVVYIDHNMGTVVKDAFVEPAPLEALVTEFVGFVDDPDTKVRDVEPADARARITEALELGAITVPPFETDTWPVCRPMVRWMAGLLPPGGTGYQRPEWDEAALAGLTERFFGSGFGSTLDDADHRGLLESLLWFGTDYGPGDPLRWSPVSVEILLLDWLPRKVVAEADYLAKAPDLLRAFIRFSHQEWQLRGELTAQTLQAVDEFEPEYQRVIRSPRPQGPAALLAAMGGLGASGGHDPWPGDDDDDDDDSEMWAELQEILLEGLHRTVGGERALEELVTTPLRDEAFDPAMVPDDIQDRVAEVLDIVDGFCAEHLDREYRTACRRFLADAAAGDPEIFRRRGKAVTAAAAVLWVIGKANLLFDPGSSHHMRVKDLTARLGTAGSASQRALPLLRAVGAEPDPYGQYGAVELGSPRYLVAERRRGILAMRELYRATNG